MSRSDNVGMPSTPTISPSGIAVLYCNLGTPSAPTAPALRRYLGEFLSDPRVVEIPRAVWWPILHGIILRTRPAKSALKYASIWTPEGSPLLVWTRRQSQALAERLRLAGLPVLVDFAMRYGGPSIPQALDALCAAGARRILLLPAYPQYSGATTGSVFDAVATWGHGRRALPELRFVNSYHVDDGYVAALAQQVQSHWAQHGRGRLLISFHGVPERVIKAGDPYQDECLRTAHALIARVGLGPDEVVIGFQSRFGRARWIGPSTQDLLAEAGRQGGRIDVFCPGFTGDCLETLEEIAQEGRALFLAAGGSEFHYIPCLNETAPWLDALEALTRRHLSGWV